MACQTSIHEILLKRCLLLHGDLWLTAEPRFEANSEAGLHYFTDTLIAQESPHWSQHQCVQHLGPKKYFYAPLFNKFLLL